MIYPKQLECVASEEWCTCYNNFTLGAMVMHFTRKNNEFRNMRTSFSLSLLYEPIYRCTILNKNPYSNLYKSLFLQT